MPKKMQSYTPKRESPQWPHALVIILTVAFSLLLVMEVTR